MIQEFDNATDKTGAVLQQIGRDLAATGRTAWLAGLGLVAEADEQGRSLFDRLVERGRPLAEKQKQTFSVASDKVERTARELGKLVNDTVEYEVRGALGRFGLATRDDLKALDKRLENLSRELDDLTVVGS
ncbi:MAG TPA: phasin family protein [Thermoanaerobaculia bacterium]|jgi:poly(hydroxyalkanoate) granule-associated protein|nr:phasin family protein [Thermoanaerobaculia bacterium]